MGFGGPRLQRLCAELKSQKRQRPPQTLIKQRAEKEQVKKIFCSEKNRFERKNLHRELPPVLRGQELRSFLEDRRTELEKRIWIAKQRLVFYPDELL